MDAFKNLDYLVAAYSFIWILIGIYLYFSGKRVTELEKKVAMLEDEKNSGQE